MPAVPGPPDVPAVPPFRPDLPAPAWPGLAPPAQSDDLGLAPTSPPPDELTDGPEPPQNTAEQPVEGPADLREPGDEDPSTHPQDDAAFHESSDDMPDAEAEPEVVDGATAAPVEAPPDDIEEPTHESGPVPAEPADPADLEPAAQAAADPDTSHAEVRPLRPPARPLPRTIAVANQKGGVGKTTTAVNLGAGLAELGFRVLVIDLDPQGNATTGLGINARNLTHSVYDVLMSEAPIEDCIEPTALRNLFVVPATIDLAGAEIELVPAFSRELRLRRAIERLGDDYDYILIDCPPSLGLLTVNGLAAVSEVLVPIQCEYYALEGLGQLMRNINLVQSNLNPRLELSTIVLTMYDARTKLSDQVVQEVKKHFGAKVCRNIVPRTVRLSEAPSYGQPIMVFDSTSRGAIAYRELAKEVSGGAAQRTG